MLQGPSLEACLKPARSFYTRFKFSEVKKNNKKKRKGGWEQIVYWSPTALRAHPLHARTDSYIQWDLMPFFPLPPFLEIIATASTNMWKGLPETQKLYIKAPSKTEVCFAHGLDSQQTSQARGREWGAGEQRWLIRRTDNAFRDQRAQEFYGSCMGNKSEYGLWHLHWWNCQWPQTPVTHNSYNNLHQLKTCPQEPCLAAPCSYC